jgi:hypothetical protein
MSDDAGTMVPDDTGAAMPDTGVEAGPPWMLDPPKVVSQGGPVMATGKVIPVFFSNDAMQSTIETFLKQLSPSSYWTATMKEYGVGDYTLGSSIVVTDPAPTNTTDTDIQNWLVAHADGTVMGWPKADPNTVYAVFYPSTTTIDIGGGNYSCQSFGAYHSDTNLLDNTNFAYAVMPRCKDLDELTAATSHELVEWATDPLPQSQTAYGDVDVDHVIWSFGGGGGEVGDMCAAYQSSYARILGNFVVQRAWSNASMKAGHDPCVPAPADPYFNAAPDLTDNVVLNFGGQGGLKTKGVKIPIGMSKTIDVHVYADGMTGPITLTAKDRSGGSTYLSFAFDSDTAMPGDVRHLTITSIKTTSSNAASFTITATSGQTKHAWYGLVGFK